MDTIRIRHVAGRQFAAWDDAGHGLVMDSIPEFKGEGTGPRPIALVLYALGGCTAMDVVSVLEKKRERVTGVEVTVTGVQREEDYPHYYEDISVEYIVKGHQISEQAVARAIELSEEKYCAVKGMFGPHVRVTSGYRVVEEG